MFSGIPSLTSTNTSSAYAGAPLSLPFYSSPVIGTSSNSLGDQNKILLWALLGLGFFIAYKELK